MDSHHVSSRSLAIIYPSQIWSTDKHSESVQVARNFICCISYPFDQTFHLYIYNLDSESRSCKWQNSGSSRDAWTFDCWGCSGIDISSCTHLAHNVKCECQLGLLVCGSCTADKHIVVSPVLCGPLGARVRCSLFLFSWFLSRIPEKGSEPTAKKGELDLLILRLQQTFWCQECSERWPTYGQFIESAPSSIHICYRALTISFIHTFTSAPVPGYSIFVCQKTRDQLRKITFQWSSTGRMHWTWRVNCWKMKSSSETSSVSTAGRNSSPGSWRQTDENVCTFAKQFLKHASSWMFLCTKWVLFKCIWKQTKIYLCFCRF